MTVHAARPDVEDGGLLRLGAAALALAAAVGAIAAWQTGVAGSTLGDITLVIVACTAGLFAAGLSAIRLPTSGPGVVGVVIVYDLCAAAASAAVRDSALAVNLTALFAIASAYCCLFASRRVFVSHLAAALGFCVIAAVHAGATLPISISAVVNLSIAVGLPAVCRRLWERARAQADAALLDRLTGILNRAGAEYRVSADVLRARERGLAAALVMVDIDDFKSVNDAHGHPAGDAVLREAAVHLTEFFGPEAVVSRIGGEEFMVYMTGTAAVLADSLTAPPPTVGRAGPAVTFSCGAAWINTARDIVTSLSDAFSEADSQMYAAKASGGNQLYGALSPTADRRAA